MLVDLEIGSRVIPHRGLPNCEQGNECPGHFVVIGLIRTPNNLFSYAILKCPKCQVRTKDDLRVSDARVISSDA